MRRRVVRSEERRTEPHAELRCIADRAIPSLRNLLVAYHSTASLAEAQRFGCSTARRPRNGGPNTAFMPRSNSASRPLRVTGPGLRRASRNRLHVKVRLDEAVANRGGMTRSQARSLIMEGRVSVEGVVATKAGQSIASDARIEIERPRRFVSRGGEKLERALDTFGIGVAKLEALDVGASTGGFTDCLLQRGAAHVTAVDVGYGQLDWRLRNDPRVTVMERVNFRLLPDDAFPQGFDVIVIDASFISLRTILERAVIVSSRRRRHRRARQAAIRGRPRAGRQRRGRARSRDAPRGSGRLCAAPSAGSASCRSRSPNRPCAVRQGTASFSWSCAAPAARSTTHDSRRFSAKRRRG